jgi:hypothetical protein
LELDSPEPIAAHIVDAVVRGKALVQEGVMRRQQLHDAAVLAEHAIHEQRDLFDEILPLVVVSRCVREQGSIRFEVVELLEV